MRRIIIVGYMGVGKTTIGNALSKETGITFYDLDWYIETRMHKTVKEIFDERGEDGFRKIEHCMLHEIAEFENIIIGCGGGTPCFNSNMDYLNRQGDTVYLKASSDVIMRHLEMGRTVRPLLCGKTSEEQKVFVEEQLAVREPFYAQAKYTFNVNIMDTRDKIDAMVKMLRHKLKI